MMQAQMLEKARERYEQRLVESSGDEIMVERIAA